MINGGFADPVLGVGAVEGGGVAIGVGFLPRGSSIVAECSVGRESNAERGAFVPCDRKEGRIGDRGRLLVYGKHATSIAGGDSDDWRH